MLQNTSYIHKLSQTLYHLYSCQLLQKYRDIGFYGTPDSCEIDAEILVYEFVSKTCEVSPGNMLIQGAKFLGQILCCFPYDLELTYDRVLRHAHCFNLTVVHTLCIG